MMIIAPAPAPNPQSNRQGVPARWTAAANPPTSLYPAPQWTPDAQSDSAFPPGWSPARTPAPAPPPPAGYLHRQHTPETRHLPRRRLVPRMLRQTQIMHRRQPGMPPQKLRHPPGLLRMRRHPQRQRPDAPQGQPAVKRHRHCPLQRLQPPDAPKQLIVRIPTDDCPAMLARILRRKPESRLWGATFHRPNHPGLAEDPERAVDEAAVVPGGAPHFVRAAGEVRCDGFPQARSEMSCRRWADVGVAAVVGYEYPQRAALLAVPYCHRNPQFDNRP